MTPAGIDLPSPSGRSKPDPDEPWRYTCPDCRRQVTRHKRGYTYRCPHCGESYQFEELYDEKEDRTVTSYVNTGGRGAVYEAENQA